MNGNQPNLRSSKFNHSKVLLLILLPICNWLNCFQWMNEVIFSSPPPKSIQIMWNEQKWTSIVYVWCQFWLIFPKLLPFACTVPIVQCALHTNTFQCHRRSNSRKINYLYTIISSRRKEKMTEYRVPRALTLSRMKFIHSVPLSTHFSWQNIYFSCFLFRMNRCRCQSHSHKAVHVQCYYYLFYQRYAMAMGNSVIDMAQKVKRRLMIVLIVNYVKENPRSTISTMESKSFCRRFS